MELDRIKKQIIDEMVKDINYVDAALLATEIGIDVIADNLTEIQAQLRQNLLKFYNDKRITGNPVSQPEIVPLESLNGKPQVQRIFQTINLRIKKIWKSKKKNSEVIVIPEDHKKRKKKKTNNQPQEEIEEKFNRNRLGISLCKKIQKNQLDSFDCLKLKMIFRNQVQNDSQNLKKNIILLQKDMTDRRDIKETFYEVLYLKYNYFEEEDEIEFEEKEEIKKYSFQEKVFKLINSLKINWIENWLEIQIIFASIIMLESMNVQNLVKNDLEEKQQ